jgi:3-hydroxyisobutyrate dehydrogenase-like beta-hydroxyacid dehydrogenase
MTTGKRKYMVGFIGIGKMGMPVVSRIAAAGIPVARIRSNTDWHVVVASILGLSHIPIPAG